MPFDAGNVLQESCFCFQPFERRMLKIFREVGQRVYICLRKKAQGFNQQAFCAAEGAQPLMDDGNFYHHRIILEWMILDEI